MLRKYKANLILIFSILSFFSCSNSPKTSLLELPSKYEGAGAVRTDSFSLKKELLYISNIFTDTNLSNDLAELWKYSNKSNSKNDDLSIFKEVLTKQGYTFFEVNPITSESIYAISKLPTLMYLLSSDYSNASELKSDSTKPDEQSLRLIKSIQKADNIITTKCSGNLHIESDEIEKIENKIYPISENSYCKVTSLFVITKLPLSEISGHINEWYLNRSYKFEKPELK
jgi:hypothetical protein